PTPWNTWLSCEEVTAGHVWECDPHGAQAARELPALGTFVHEAVAVDPQTLQLYLTEDMRDGRFYRFTPATASNGVPDLTRGVLEAAEAASPTGGRVTWHVIGDPSAATTPTRLQAAASTAFAGGEGAWYADEMIYFTTKHDNRVWAYNIGAQQLDLVYDGSRHDPLLNGVDNVTVAQNGTVYVAEDGGNMQIVGIDPGQRIFPVVQVIGHQASEVTGPAFDPSGTRLYFSSQRGSSGSPLAGVTYEVAGPFDQM
ncbi:MAG TPA: alkaline phosphatase PhoX, partial [Gammaproteobacteria bacterium]